MPTAAPQKTIHQRHKSSPALSTTANAGALRAAAKRTAFGDVSNTANTWRSSKDDLITTNKGEGLIEKVATLKADQKTISLLRPAQRPISVTAKALADNVLTTFVVAPPKQPLAAIQTTLPANHVAHTRNVLTKKSTAALKDIAEAPTTEHPVSDLPSSFSSTAPAPPVHRDLQTLRAQELGDTETKLRRTRNKAALNVQPKQPVAEPLNVGIPSEEPAAVRSDGVYIDNHGEVRLYQFTDDLDPPRKPSIPAFDDGLPLPPEVVPRPYHYDAKKHSGVEPRPLDAQGMPPPPDQKHQLVPLSEPEEYWDEEEDDENYVEDGYVTARSYRSRGENTTSGATTVLFPKANLKTRKELANATALMDAAKAAGELDDETWDTTMVAEYGDEIFQYMRELEVNSCALDGE